MWGCEDDPENPEAVILEGIGRYRAFLRRIGMPLTLEEIGGREEDIPKLANSACRGNGRGGTLDGFVSLTEEDVANVYRLML